MIIDGYEITVLQNGRIRISEIADQKTKSWEAMEKFCTRFPLGTEPEWGRFVIRHTEMQRREVEGVLRKFRRQ